jgi:hypothetical protein
MTVRSYPALQLLICLLTAGMLLAQNQSTPDVLVLNDGEKLIGKLQRATDTKVIFDSDMAGEVTVLWSNIQELRSDRKFAAIPKNVRFRNSEEAAQVPQGTVRAANQKLEVMGSGQTAAQTIPVGEVSNLLPSPAFEQSLHPHSFFRGWFGEATLGVSLTQATVKVHDISSSVNLLRSDPPQRWLQLRTRTTVNFTSQYDHTYSQGAPGTKTNIYRANAVEDFFLSPRFFLFAGASFEHISPQGLELTQAYGAGPGVVVHKTDRSELDARAGLGYMNQQFDNPSLNKKLIGSRFAEDYTLTLGRGITLFEQAGVRPAWNYSRAFFGGALVTLTVPLYHRLGLNVTSFDSFLNDPPPGFRKNTFQLTIGASYGIR